MLDMANVYSQIHIHVVFAVKHRLSLIEERWEDELYKYITGIVQKRNHKLLAINGMTDHLHLCVGLNPSQSISDLVKEAKVASTNWINKNGFCYGKFEWQSGYGVFSYSKSQLSKVVNYINNQKIHHQKKSFVDEYLYFLKNSDKNYDPRVVFDDITVPPAESRTSKP